MCLGPMQPTICTTLREALLASVELLTSHQIAHCRCFLLAVGLAKSSAPVLLAETSVNDKSSSGRVQAVCGRQLPGKSFSRPVAAVRTVQKHAVSHSSTVSARMKHPALR